MHICYLDESGSQSRNANTSYFILLGLAIPAATWRAKDADIASILDVHHLFGEVHTAWMARRFPEQERIKDFERLSPEDRAAAVEKERKIDLAKAALKGRKAISVLARNYAKTAHYVHMAHNERINILRALADKIGAWQDVVLFADAQRKSVYPVTTDDSVIMAHAFEQVVTRFHTYLNRENIDLGILVQDQNDTAAHRLTQLARRYHMKGTRYSTVSRLVETPLFVDSTLTSMVQLADLCSFAVRRFFEKGQTDFFDRVYSRFDRSAGKLVGLRHFTGKEKCSCKVCKDHGRKSFWRVH